MSEEDPQQNERGPDQDDRSQIVRADIDGNVINPGSKTGIDHPRYQLQFIRESFSCVSGILAVIPRIRLR